MSESLDASFLLHENDFMMRRIRLMNSVPCFDRCAA